MKYFAALLKMKDLEKNAAYREPHLSYLTRTDADGKIFARGRFAGNEGGLVVYMAESLDEARKLAEADPLVTSGARTLELYEWEMHASVR